MLAGPLQGHRVAVERKPMTLGRGAECTLVVPDEEMALRHAVIEHRADGLFIKDLGAMGGIVVNGRELKESRLRHGDEVELGRTRFLVQALVQADVASSEEQPRTGRRNVRAVLLMLLACAAGLYVFLKRQEAQTPAAGPQASKTAPAPATNGPAAEPEAAAPAAPVQPVTLVTAAVEKAGAEIRAMQEDLTELRKRMQELTAVQASVTSPPQAAVATSAVAVAAPAPAQTNSLESKVEGMLKDAGQLIEAGREADADRVLDSVEVISPGTLEAYERRARLFEKRRMPERAMDQWLELIDRGKGSAYYDRAVTEFGRLDAQLAQLPPPKKGMLRIASVEPHKFPENAEFSEMRVLDITFAPVSANDAIDMKAVRTEVTFFDEDLASGRIVATRAMVAVSPPKPEREWLPGETRTVTATYLVPRQPGAPVPRREQYYGYAVRVFLGGAPQAEDARPTSLLGMAPAGPAGDGRQAAGQ